MSVIVRIIGTLSFFFFTFIFEGRIHLLIRSLPLPFQLIVAVIDWSFIANEGLRMI